jgi:hypothetical protein
VAIRLHGVFQNFRTAPFLEAALQTYRRSDGKSEGTPEPGLLTGFGELLNDECASRSVARLPIGLLNHVNLHFLPLFFACYRKIELFARLGELFDDERAPGRVARLLFGLLEHLNLHDVSLLVSTMDGGTERSAQVFERDVDEPGAQRAFLLVCLAIVLHGVSPSVSVYAS